MARGRARQRGRFFPANEIHAAAGGLLYWLHYNTSTSLSAGNNHFFTTAGAVAQHNTGIMIVTLQDAVGISLTNNSIRRHRLRA